MGTMILSDPLAESAAKMEREYSLVPYIGMNDGGAVVYGGDYVRQTKRWVATIIETAKAEMSADPEVRNYQRYVDLIMGRHWTGAAPSWRPRPVVNKLAKHFWDNLANTADFRFSMEVSTSSKEETYRSIASSLTTLTQANFRSQHGMAAMMFCAMFASLNLGAIKVTRDRETKKITYTPLGSDAFLPILGNVFDFQKSGGCIHRMMKPISWFKRYHKDVERLIRPEKPPAEFQGGVDPLALGSASYAPWARKGEYGISQLMNNSTDQFGIRAFATEEGCPYLEIHFRDPQINLTGGNLVMGRGNHKYTVRPREPIYPWGRRISVAGETDPVILDDGPNMHWHGWYPFAVLRLRPVPWMWSGISDLRDLVAINNPMNRLLGDAVSLVDQAAKPTVVTRENSLSAQEWADYYPGQSGAKLKLLNRTLPVTDQIHFITPPTGALGAVATFWEILNRAFSEQSGQGYGSRMASKKQVPGADAVQAIQESEQGIYRVKGIFTEIFFEELGRLSMSDVAQFYDPNQIIATLGDDEETVLYLDQDPGKLDIPQTVSGGGMREGNRFVSQFNAMMTAGSSLPARRREQANLALVLAAQGKLSMETLFKRLNAIGAGLPSADSEIKRIINERKMLPMADAAKKGKGKVPQVSSEAPVQ
jgi:hypothetical protein